MTTPADAQAAAAAGADVLVVQGSEAGGHRSSFTDDPADDPSGGFGLLVAAPARRAAGRACRSSRRAASAPARASRRCWPPARSAAQLGTAFLRCPEAGTATVQRAAVATGTPTAMTRAFTGRLARGIRNRFLDAHSAHAPCAYPEVHYLTAPLRAAGRAAGDPDLVNLWAGQTHELSQRPAGRRACRAAGRRGAGSALPRHQRPTGAERPTELRLRCLA